MSVLQVNEVRAAATGILMARWNIDPLTASTAIREVAVDLGVDLDDLAALVVAAPFPASRRRPVRLSLVPNPGDKATSAFDRPAMEGWPGQGHGLTNRESQVVARIVDGLSNNEIAAGMHLSLNSVKTYIRSAYKKAGVTNRSLAILWGLGHGFQSRKLT